MRRLLALVIVSLFAFTSCVQQVKKQEENIESTTENRIQASETAINKTQEKQPVKEKEPEVVPFKEIKQGEEGFKPVPPRRYLLVNGIQVDPKSTSKETPELNMRVDYPEIKGLADKKLQEKLNKEFAEEAEKFIDKPIPPELGLRIKPGVQGQKYEKWYSFSTNANYNNILSLCFYYNEVYGAEYNENRSVPVLYELKSGKRLGINDLFVDGVDGIKLINEKLVSHIIKESLEEWVLCRPFQGIAQNQPFYITENMLVILFDERNTEFVYPNYQIGIPFEELGSAIAVYDKYSDSTEKLYEKEKLLKKMLPAPIKVKWDFKREDKPEYNIWIQIARFENLTNKELENKLNSLTFDFNLEDFKKTALKSYESLKEKVPSSRVVNMNVHASMGDVLSISTYDGTNIAGKEVSSQRKFVCYNTKTGKELVLKDLFNKGFDYKKIIRENVIRQLGDRIIPDAEIEKLDTAIDEARFFIDDMAVHLNFKPGMLSKEIQDEIQIFTPFEDFGQENVSIYN